jgi:hypothetical protein
MKEYERENKGRNKQVNPRSRSNSFPTQRGWKIDRKCRSRSSLSFPQEETRIMGGIWRY